MPADIRRDSCLSRLIRLQGPDIIKIITGIRGCGKTYLLFTQFRNYLLCSGIDESRIIEMRFDDPRNERFRDPDVFCEYLESRMRAGGTYHILLDEVSQLGEFEAVLNGLLYGRNADVYVTGSFARHLTRDVATEFRGRGLEIHMSPLSFAEFAAVCDGSRYDAWEEYRISGGLPQAVLASGAEAREKVLEDLLRETYIPEIARRNGIRSRDALSDLLSVIARSAGKFTDPETLAGALLREKGRRLSVRSVIRYADSLEDAFIITKIGGYDTGLRRYAGSRFKYFFSDPGLLWAVRGFGEPDEMQVLEHVICNELLARGYETGACVPGQSEGECADGNEEEPAGTCFICESAPKRYYVRPVTSLPDSVARQREESSLLRIRDAFKKAIVTTDSLITSYTDSGVLVAGLFDFLKDEQSLDTL